MSRGTRVDKDNFDVLISTADPESTREQGQGAATHDTAGPDAPTPDEAGQSTSVPWARTASPLPATREEGQSHGRTVGGRGVRAGRATRPGDLSDDDPVLPARTRLRAPSASRSPTRQVYNLRPGRNTPAQRGQVAQFGAAFGTMPAKYIALPVLERLATEQQRVSVFKPEDLGDYAKDSKPQQKGRDVELFTKDVHEDGAYAYTKDCMCQCINYLLNFNYLNVGKEGQAMCFLEDLFLTKTQHLW